MTLKQILRLLVVILGLLVLLGTTVFLVLRWSGIPEQIPAHFDGAGHIDGYESKDSLIGLLVLAWVFWLLMIVLARVPRLLKQNGGFVRVEPERHHVYDAHDNHQHACDDLERQVLLVRKAICCVGGEVRCRLEYANSEHELGNRITHREDARLDVAAEAYDDEQHEE